MDRFKINYALVVPRPPSVQPMPRSFRVEVTPTQVRMGRGCIFRVDACCTEYVLMHSAVNIKITIGAPLRAGRGWDKKVWLPFDLRAVNDVVNSVDALGSLVCRDVAWRVLGFLITI